MSLSERKQIFNADLLAMKNAKLIDQETHDNVYKASDNFYTNQLETEMQQKRSERKPLDQTRQEIKAEGSTVQRRPIKEKVKHVINEQEASERKSSILLNLGVLFLFLAGLIFATTNWNNLELFGRAASMGFMGCSLYAGSYVAENKLHIQKTGHALWILTTLYIPIVGVTFIYSLLWNNGTNLGDPKSLLSLAALSIVSAALNFMSVKKYGSKFYVWAVYTTSELSLLLFAGSFKLDFTAILFVTTLSNLAIAYCYLRIADQRYKNYTGKYLKILSFITSAIGLLDFNNISSITCYFVILLTFATLLTVEYILDDKDLGILAVGYLFIRSIIAINVYNLNTTILVIPALIIFAIFYFGDKIKTHKETTYVALMISFIIFNISILSYDILFSLGVIGVILTGWIVYTKEETIKIGGINTKEIYELILPVYMYTLIARVPMVLIKELSNIQTTMILCIAAIIISVVQLIIKEQYAGIKTGFSKVSAIILMICSLISITSIESMTLMLVSLAIFQKIGAYKKFNILSYFVSLIMAIGIIVNSIYKYTEIQQCLFVVSIAALLLGMSRLMKKDEKYIIFIASLFLISCTFIFNSTIMILLAILAILIALMIYTLKNEQLVSLLICAMAVGINLQLIPRIMLDNGGLISRQTIILLISVVYALGLAAIGSVYFKELNENKRFDSLTIVGMGIITITSILSYSSYTNIAITTIGSLILVGLSIKRLEKSIAMRLFTVLKLVLAYVQVITLLDADPKGIISIIPILLLAIASKYWIFKTKQYGEIAESIALVILNLMVLSFSFSLDLYNSIAVITLGIVILIISYSKRIKLYLTTSLIMIIPILINCTLGFWESIPWWVYLLVIGVTLITLGSIAERKGTKFKELKNTIFRDWN